MIKINHITNLHDARFAAAEKVDFISFALGKGNLKKISLTTYQDIIQWIAGTYVVADFEKDFRSLLEFLDKSIPYDFIQIHEDILSQVPSNYYNQIIVKVETEHSGLKYLQEGFIVESILNINQEKHFRIIEKFEPKQANIHYSLEGIFFLENYELDYELFNEWNRNF